MKTKFSKLDRLMMLVTYAGVGESEGIRSYLDGRLKKAENSRQSGKISRKTGHSLFPKTA